MTKERLARATAPAAVVTIVAVLALLAIGLVGGRAAGGGGDVELATAASSVDDGPASTPAHDDHADAPSTTATPTTAAHGHGEEVHGEDDHGHDEQAVGVVVPASSGADHGHDASVTHVTVGGVPATVPHVDAHDHVATDTTVAGSPTTTVHDHAVDETVDAMPTGPLISLDDPRVTDAQRQAAQDLIDVTTAAMARFTDEASVTGAGYLSIGDGGTGFEHFVHWGHLVDGAELDPDRIESIVMRVSGGTKSVVSAMYILNVGDTMADVPDIAGELTTWHDHQNLCWEGTRVVGVTRDGVCARGTFIPTPPMLHVWMTEHPCGPFAGIEGGHGHGCGH